MTGGENGEGQGQNKRVPYDQSRMERERVEGTERGSAVAKSRRRSWPPNDRGRADGKNLSGKAQIRMTHAIGGKVE